MKLTIMERFKCLEVLPERANLSDIKIIHQTRMALSFSEEEQKEYGFITKRERTTWNSDKQDEKKDIKLGNKAMVIIAEALKQLDERRELTEQHIALYQKFCEKE